MATYNFDLPIDEVIEEAYELASGDQLGAQDLRSLRRSLNLLLIDIQNRDIPLSNLEKISVPLVQGQVEYTLDAKVLDLMNVVIQRDSVDLPMTRMGLFDYNSQPNKTQEGRSITYVVDRQKAAVILSVWPAPDNSTDVVSAWAFRKTADISNYTDYVDLATRYLPAITTGLASFFALKKNIEKYPVLNAVYEQQLTRAFEEDRERTSFFITPLLNKG